MQTDLHTHYMRQALQQAQRAREAREVPTGCVIVDAAAPQRSVSLVVGRAHNQVELLRDPTAHAEMLAITQATEAIGNWRLTDTVLYVTKEPCAMCAGAIVLARIPLVVFGVPDPARGGESVFHVLDHPQLNHRCQIVSGVLENDCRDLLQNFFRERR